MALKRFLVCGFLLMSVFALSQGPTPGRGESAEQQKAQPQKAQNQPQSREPGSNLTRPIESPVKDVSPRSDQQGESNQSKSGWAVIVDAVAAEPNWIIAFFTGVLMVVTFLQLLLLSRSITLTEKDQVRSTRAYLSIDAPTDQIHLEASPIHTLLRIQNTGRSVAQVTRLGATFHVGTNEGVPEFSPGEVQVDFPITGGQTFEYPVFDKTGIDSKGGKAFFSKVFLHARIVYTDVFESEHETSVALRHERGRWIPVESPGYNKAT